MIQEHREVMVIDGLGYQQSSWDAGTLPDFDVDRYGNWYDLTVDCQVHPGWGPDALPDRYAMWPEQDGTRHLFAIEPGSGGVRELALREPNAPGLAVLSCVDLTVDLTDDQVALVERGVADLPASGWEITADELLAVARGVTRRFGDAMGLGAAADGSPLLWFRSPTRSDLEAGANQPASALAPGHADQLARPATVDQRTPAPLTGVPGVHEQ
ncbi:MAG TPA: hypothetical protein VFO60_10435, partial [Candidatus Dormibacteraeota bacterium]|nr:hypothetical protein [Candidatus Dormibacteraeota bacterium]